MHGLARIWRGGQYDLLILEMTVFSSSSMKMAESGLLFDIFSSPLPRPGIMAVHTARNESEPRPSGSGTPRSRGTCVCADIVRCERMMGLNLRLMCEQ